MEPAKIQRINELARKKKSEGLTDAEAAEQQILRNEYLVEIRTNFRKTLDSIEITE